MASQFPQPMQRFIQPTLDFARDNPRIGKIYRLRSTEHSFEPKHATGGQVLLTDSDGVWRTEIEGFRPGITPIVMSSADSLAVSVLQNGEPVASRTRDASVEALRIYSLLDPRIVLSRSRSTTQLPDRDILVCEVFLEDLGLPREYLTWLGQTEMVRTVRLVYSGIVPLTLWQADVPPQTKDTIVVAYG